MNLIESIGNTITRFGQKFNPADPNNQNTNDFLPFVHTFGYEKQYGKVYPHDFARMVEAYKSWAWACGWKNATSCAKIDLELYKKIPGKKRR